MKKIILFIAVAVVFIFIIILVFNTNTLEENNEESIYTSSKDGLLQIGEGVFVKIEIAKTKEDRIRGLSGKKQLDVDSGMLFIFDKPNIYKFWMKDMNFPIDIIWIDKDFIIKDITHGATPQSYPKLFSPNVPVQYVLEVPSGFALKNNINEGISVIYKK